MKIVQKHALCVGGIVALLIGMFFVGSAYGSKKGNNFGKLGGTNFGQMDGRNIGKTPTGGKNMRGGAGFIRGEVVSKDANSITLKLNDGGSKILLYSNATIVEKTVSGTLDDVVVGTNLMVIGDQNLDGSVSAKTLQITPALILPVPTPVK